MASKADLLAVRKHLEQARNQRNQIVRGAPLPIDTAHLVGSCVKCGRLGFTILGFPDPPYAGPQGQPRFRNARELERFLDDLVKRPPPMPSPEDTQNGQLCACGAPADPRQIEGLRFMHAMPGTGAELVVEGIRGGGSLLVSVTGDSLGGDEFRWKLYRAPVDGIETEIADRFDDAAIEKAFGRPLTLAHTWRRILDAARNGVESLEQVEPGYWIWAGPREDTGLEEKIRQVVQAENERKSYPLVSLGQHAPMPVGPAWPQWAHEHAQAIGKGELRAGVIVDLAVVRKLITAQLGRMNIGWHEEQNGALVIAEVGDARWPVEVSIVALGAGHLGWTLAETVAAAVGEAAARVQVLQQFLGAARKMRPEIQWKVEGMRLTPVRKDGTLGRPVNLMVTPFQLQPGTPDFEREIRFVADEIPEGADPTRHCPCGAQAFVAARLFPWAVVEEFMKATKGKMPYVIEQWPADHPKAALLATISCDRHVRIPSAEEIQQAGLVGEAFEKRLSSDLPQSIFAVDVSLHEDKSKKRALLAYGPLVASVVVNDHLVSALHEACGRPLRAQRVEAEVTTPNVLVMYEEGFDDDQLDRVLEMGASQDGIPPGAPTPFSLSWEVSLTAIPLGRFQNLYPPPDAQGAPGAPPQRPRPHRPAALRN